MPPYFFLDFQASSQRDTCSLSVAKVADAQPPPFLHGQAAAALLCRPAHTFWAKPQSCVLSCLARVRFPQEPCLGRRWFRAGSAPGLLGEGTIPLLLDSCSGIPEAFLIWSLGASSGRYPCEDLAPPRLFFAAPSSAPPFTPAAGRVGIGLWEAPAALCFPKYPFLLLPPWDPRVKRVMDRRVVVKRVEGKATRSML